MRQKILAFATLAMLIFSCISISSANANETDSNKFVLEIHVGYLEWFWNSPSDSPVINYTVQVFKKGSNLSALKDPISVFVTKDNFFIPADHGYADSQEGNSFCVTPNLENGSGLTYCNQMNSLTKPQGYVLSLNGAPSPIYKVNGKYQRSILSPFESGDKQPKGWNGYSFSATDSVFLGTNIFSYQPPYVSIIQRCDADGKCVNSPEQQKGFWNQDVTTNYVSATTSTKDACEIHTTKIKTSGQTAVEIKPLRNNIDCRVSASVKVPFISAPEVKNDFTIHFQKLPFSIVVTYPNGEVNSTVGSVTDLDAQDIPQWNWIRDSKSSFAMAATFVKFSKENRSLTPEICSVKRTDEDTHSTLSIRGLAVGECRIEIDSPERRMVTYPSNKYTVSPIISEASKRVLTFNVKNPKVNSKSFTSRYACMVADTTENTYRVFNLANKKLAPPNCQTNSSFISTLKN